MKQPYGMDRGQPAGDGAVVVKDMDAAAVGRLTGRTDDDSPDRRPHPDRPGTGCCC
jgi:hypothetical protein